jgi:metal-sulfur cluster biosynthetic enzyme
MALNEEQIREALKQVVDPELFVNIIDLGLVYTVTAAPAQQRDVAATSATAPTPASAAAAQASPASASNPAPSADTTAVDNSGEPQEDVFIEMTMTSPACPAGPHFITGAKKAVGRLPGLRNL